MLGVALSATVVSQSQQAFYFVCLAMAVWNLKPNCLGQGTSDTQIIPELAAAAAAELSPPDAAAAAAAALESW